MILSSSLAPVEFIRSVKSNVVEASFWRMTFL
jgi:hypothetical protein